VRGKGGERSVKGCVLLPQEKGAEGVGSCCGNEGKEGTEIR
jgi:hypothetical protein